MSASLSRRMSAVTKALFLAVVVSLLAGVTGMVRFASASASRPSATNSVPGLVLVKYRGGTRASAVDAIQRQAGAVEVGRVPAIGVHVLRVSVGAVDAVIGALSHNPAVSFAERDFERAPADTIPNDPYFLWSGTHVQFGGQWGDGLTQAKQAWDITKGSPSVVVAIVDSGIDGAHPDLAGQTTTGVSIVGGSTTDTSGHGEYVAGTVGESANNGIGAAGYCWFCKLMPVKITTTGSATDSDMASGITWATDHGARVINVSYAGTSRSSTLDPAVAYATNHGAIVVAAAGNSGCNCVNYPAGSPGAIAVAASDQVDNLMTYSDWGSWVQVAAPTGDITTWLTDPVSGLPYGYGPVGGTSISSPVVAGIIALMWSAHPTATADQIKGALFSSVDPITGVSQSGAPVTVKYGRVNAYKALLAVTGQAPAPTSTSSPSPTSSSPPSPTASPTPTAPAAPTPTPAPTATPSPTPTPTPSASPTQTPSPTPTPTPTATTSTSSFSGTVNANQQVRTFSISVGSGSLSANLSAISALSLSLLAPSGSAVSASQGSSTSLTALVSPGTYTLRVAYLGSKANFKLSAVYPTP